MDFLSKLMRSRPQSPQSQKSFEIPPRKIVEQPQTPLKNQHNKSEIEEKPRQAASEISKENYNPRSLSEIAADTTTKLTTHLSENNSISNTTSTPKIVHKESLKQDVSSDFDLDSSIDSQNYNPKSLSEIAANTTAKLTSHLSENISISNTTSTPNIVHKESLKPDVSSDFDLDSSIDNRPKLPRNFSEAPKTDLSSSFLTDGFNKLRIDSPVDSTNEELLNTGGTILQSDKLLNKYINPAETSPEIVSEEDKIDFPKSSPGITSSILANDTDGDFMSCGGSYNFADADFDFLQNSKSKDIRSFAIPRDSVLENFDPLLAKQVLIETRLPATQEKEEDFFADFELKIPVQDISQNSSTDITQKSLNTSANDHSSHQLLPIEDEMSLSVDIMKDINVDNKTSETNHIAETKLNSHSNEDYDLKMADMENKMKKEVEKIEEALLKRISEKDKQITKMNGVVEAYEKAISELIAEKEQIVQSYEKKCNGLKGDSELNANHLASLEATFSDLHAKYERTKQTATELKEREEHIFQDRKALTESLKMQEARYDKMKSHAMSQLEIANSTLAEINRNHQAEVTKLKAQLKKEEISRASINEQLIQKTKENSELVKICDELINGTQS